jgi:hypothetical protein
MVEGVFARAFRSGLRPIELGRRLVREIDDQRSVDVRGRTVVPNAFRIHLSPGDHAQFGEIHDALIRELADAAREYAREEGYHFMGPVTVELLSDPRRRVGTFDVEARMRAGAGGYGAGSLVLPSGQRVPLGERVATIGRLPECEIKLDDPNVSRRHAELAPSGDSFLVRDLGSTNGTKVNGIRVTERLLEDGDEVVLGNTRLRFEAS